MIIKLIVILHFVYFKCNILYNDHTCVKFVMLYININFIYIIASKLGYIGILRYIHFRYNIDNIFSNKLIHCFIIVDILMISSSHSV